MIQQLAFGCILGELVTTVPLFQGKTEGDQLFSIFKVMGSPTKEEFQKFAEKVPFDKKIFDEFQNYEAQNLRKMFYYIKDIDNLMDLITKCLQYLPENRISAEEALSHPFFKGLEEKYP